MFFDNSESLVTFDLKVKESLDSTVKTIKEHPEWNFSLEESGSKRVLRGKIPFFKLTVPPLRLELQLIDQNSPVKIKGKLFWAEIYHFIQNSMTFGFIGFAILFFGIEIFSSDIRITFKIILSIIDVLFFVSFFSVFADVYQKKMGKMKKDWTELYKQRFIDYLSDKNLLDS